MVSSLEFVSKLWRLVEAHVPVPLAPTPRDFNSAGLGWGAMFCISNKFQGNADESGLGATL